MCCVFMEQLLQRGIKRYKYPVTLSVNLDNGWVFKAGDMMAHIWREFLFTKTHIDVVYEYIVV